MANGGNLISIKKLFELAPTSKAFVFTLNDNANTMYVLLDKGKRRRDLPNLRKVTVLQYNKTSGDIRSNKVMISVNDTIHSLMVSDFEKEINSKIEGLLLINNSQTRALIRKYGKFGITEDKG